HERAPARLPSHASAATPATAGIARRYAAIYQSGVVGWNDGSQPVGLAPNIASRISCSLSSNAVLRAVVGTAAYASVATTPAAMKSSGAKAATPSARSKSIAGRPTQK